LSEQQEAAIEEAITSEDDRAERVSGVHVDNAYVALAEARGLKPVHIKTIRKRIKGRDQNSRFRARHGKKKANEKHGPVRAGFQIVDRALGMVQIDHTACPVEAVDPVTRESIGRPTMTLTVDVGSRVVVSVMASMRHPSSILTAEALSRAILPKDEWLRHLGIPHIAWPYHGQMSVLHTDNGSDLTADALESGCALLDIQHRKRRVRIPQDGPHVERLLGSIQADISDLPGKTFRNTLERQGYDSEGHACLTVEDIERIAAIDLDKYHHSIHSELCCTPNEMWTQLSRYVPRHTHSAIFVRIALLPAIYRKKIQRYGLRHNRRDYINEDMIGWIGKSPPASQGEFLFKIHPDDSTHIYFYEPNSGRFCVAHASRPAKTQAQIDHYNKVMRENGGRRASPAKTAQAYRARKGIVDAAVAKTKQVKRDTKRRRRSEAKSSPADWKIAEGERVADPAGHSKSTLASALDTDFVDESEVVAFNSAGILRRDGYREA